MPNLIIFAGINGAGKSTLYNYEKDLVKLETLGVRVNADEILKNFGGDWKNFKDVKRSARKTLELIEECLNNKISFNWETTNISSFAIRLINNAKALGYEVRLFFIGVEKVEQAIERVKKRVEKGGHGVPEYIIRSRFKNQFLRLEEILPLIDNALFIDNKNTIKVVGSYLNNNLTYYDKENIWMQNIVQIVDKIKDGKGNKSVGFDKK